MKSLEEIAAVALTVTIALCLWMAATTPAQAQTFTTIYSLVGGKTDGENPYAGVIGDGAGNLYGTTCFGGTYFEGNVFQVNTAGTETVLHDFVGQPTDGSCPLT